MHCYFLYNIKRGASQTQLYVGKGSNSLVPVLFTNQHWKKWHGQVKY